MEFTEEDKQALQRMGNKELEVRQIAASLNETKYSVNGESITAERAVEILGREVFLEGLMYSTFHRLSDRNGLNGEVVYFDSSEYYYSVNLLR